MRLGLPDGMAIGLCFTDPMRSIDRLVDRLEARGCRLFYSLWLWPIMILKGYK